MSGSFVPFVRGSTNEYARAVDDPIPLYREVPARTVRAWAGTAATCGVLVAALIAVVPALPSQDVRGRSRFAESQPAAAPVLPAEAVLAGTAPDRDVVVRAAAARGTPGPHRGADEPHRPRT